MDNSSITAISFAEIIKQSTLQLSHSSDSAQLDVEVLLCYVLQKDRSHLRAWPEKTLSPTQLHDFHALLQQRLAGQPIAYLTGQREFWSLQLKVNSHTLIPRPETELLIETLLDLYPTEASLNLADLGTGSGAIALAIASERPNWRIIATDIDAPSVQLARANAEQHQLKNIEFLQGSWLQPLAQTQLNIIISNPPYIANNDPHLLQGDVRYEPARALSSGPDGLDDIRHLCQHAPACLKSGAILMLEHGYDQQQEMLDIFTLNNYKNIQQRRDLSNNYRLTFGYKS